MEERELIRHFIGLVGDYLPLTGLKGTAPEHLSLHVLEHILRPVPKALNTGRLEADEARLFLVGFLPLVGELFGADGRQALQAELESPVPEELTVQLEYGHVRRVLAQRGLEPPASSLTGRPELLAAAVVWRLLELPREKRLRPFLELFGGGSTGALKLRVKIASGLGAQPGRVSLGGDGLEEYRTRESCLLEGADGDTVELEIAWVSGAGEAALTPVDAKLLGVGRGDTVGVIFPEV
ncbi:MAG: hypothetical protein GF399_00145 [Candidatus Coatesbacteria bacterium]|nr:hypothetical protein [Candidatus Coatesbacteria bacterium]